LIAARDETPSDLQGLQIKFFGAVQIAGYFPGLSQIPERRGDLKAVR
jgi:hypothetical protein